MKKVLVLDDDQSILEALTFVLADADYQVVGATDLPSFEKALHSQKPDVLLLDIFVNTVDGRELCRQLKSAEKTKDIPVILMSAESKTQRSIKDTGAAAYLEKPFEIDTLLKVIQTYA